MSDAGPAPQPHSPRGAIRNQRPIEIGRAVLLKAAMIAEETECFGFALTGWGQHIMVAPRETQCCTPGQIGNIGGCSDCAVGVLLHRYLEHLQVSQHLYHGRLVGCNLISVLIQVVVSGVHFPNFIILASRHQAMQRLLIDIHRHRRSRGRFDQTDGKSSVPTSDALCFPDRV